MQSVTEFVDHENDEFSGRGGPVYQSKSGLMNKHIVKHIYVRTNKQTYRETYRDQLSGHMISALCPSKSGLIMNKHIVKHIVNLWISAGLWVSAGTIFDFWCPVPV